jgi:hypothetical protein
MSIETWKEKFFHVPADAPSLDTALKRLDHSIRMWVGFRKKSLEKHDLAAPTNSFCIRFTEEVPS